MLVEEGRRAAVSPVSQGCRGQQALAREVTCGSGQPGETSRATSN